MKLRYLLPLLLITLSLQPAPFSKVSALSGSDFQAGRIIDDSVFTNKYAMSVSQIQSFLNAKLPFCDRYRHSSNPNYKPP